MVSLLCLLEVVPHLEYVPAIPTTFAHCFLTATGVFVPLHFHAMFHVWSATALYVVTVWFKLYGCDDWFFHVALTD